MTERLTVTVSGECVLSATSAYHAGVKLRQQCSTKTCFFHDRIEDMFDFPVVVVLDLSPTVLDHLSFDMSARLALLGFPRTRSRYYAPLSKCWETLRHRCKTDVRRLILSARHCVN
jgi:hypothetical protein